MFKFSKFADAVAIESDSGQVLTYSELDLYVSQLAAKISKRKLVFVLCENSVGSLIGYLAALKSDAVPVLIERDLNIELLKQLIENYRPEFLLAPDSFLFPEPQSAVIHQGWGFKLFAFETLNANEIHENLGLLLSTSGSTGSPKFVRISKENLRTNTEAIVSYLNITSEDRAVTSLPMNYTYGLSVINTHLVAGATILLTKMTLFDKGFWTFFNEKKGTSLSGVPFMYEMLKKMRFFSMSVPSLKKMTQAGGKLSKELAIEFLEFAKKANIDFTIMYGQTEATARISYLPSAVALSKPDSIGIAIPGGKLRLVGADGNYITEPGIEGELEYFGPNVALGYSESRLDLGKGDEWQSILKTGDLAKMDAEGYFYISGRLKRFIKLHGKRINLDEIEKIAKRVTHDCACTGIDNLLEVYLVDETLGAKVKELVISLTGIHPTSLKVYVCKEIPKNSSGKIKYSELKREG